MKQRSMLTLLAFAVIMAFTLTACEKEGTTEKAGKAIDKAFDVVKDKYKEVTK